jgi:hypothetical protein
MWTRCAPTAFWSSRRPDVVARSPCSGGAFPKSGWNLPGSWVRADVDFLACLGDHLLKGAACPSAAVGL